MRWIPHLHTYLTICHTQWLKVIHVCYVLCSYTLNTPICCLKSQIIIRNSISKCEHFFASRPSQRHSLWSRANPGIFTSHWTQAWASSKPVSATTRFPEAPAVCKGLDQFQEGTKAGKLLVCWNRFDITVEVPSLFSHSSLDWRWRINLVGEDVSLNHNRTRHETRPHGKAQRIGSCRLSNLKSGHPLKMTGEGCGSC